MRGGFIWSFSAAIVVFISFGDALLVAQVHSAAPAENSQPSATGLSEIDRKSIAKERDAALKEAGRRVKAEEFAEAAAKLRGAVELQKRLFEPDHPEVSKIITLLADVESMRGDYSAARVARLEVLTTATNRWGKDSWQTVDARLAVADCDLMLGAEAEKQANFAKANRLLKRTESLSAPSKVQEAEELAAQAVRLYTASVGAENWLTAKALLRDGVCLTQIRQFEKAEAAVKRAAGIYEKVVGRDHPSFGESVNELSNVYYAQSKFAAALPLTQQARAIFEKAMGQEAPRTLEMLSNEAAIRSVLGDYKSAIPMAEEAVRLREKVLGANHPHTALSLNNLADMYKAQGAYAAALPLCQRALEIRKNAFGESHPMTISNLITLAEVYDRTGDYESSSILYQKTMDLCEQVYSADDPMVATAMEGLGTEHMRQGNYSAAEQLMERALEIREKRLGPNDIFVALGLGNLADVRERLGKCTEAIQCARRAVEICEKFDGGNGFQTAGALMRLAILYQEQGEYAKAMPLLQRALEINQKTYGSEGRDTAVCMECLARLYMAQHDSSAARRLFQQALAINEKILGKEHPELTTQLDSLGSLDTEEDDYVTADIYLRRSLQIREKCLGPEHPDVATSLDNLASLRGRRGTPMEGIPLIERAIKIGEQKLGHDHPITLSYCGTLAYLYHSAGNYQAAAPILKRIVESSEKVLGPEHLQTLGALYNMAMCRFSQNDPAGALPFAQRAAAIARKQLDETAVIQSERQQILMQGVLVRYMNLLIASGVAAKSDPSELYESVLAWKGAIFARQRWMRAARNSLRDNAEAARVYAEMEDKSRLLASGYSAKLKAKEPGDQGVTLERLAADIESCQRRLADLSSEFRATREVSRTKPSDLQKSLPERTALVDIVEYRAYYNDDLARQLPRWQQRYVAFVVRPDRPIVMVDLGRSDRIQGAVALWRYQQLPGEATDDNRDAAVSLQKLWNTNYGEGVSVGGVLREWIWNRIAPHVEGCETVLISPAGALNYLPWGALPGKKAQTYLLEDVSISVIATPQMLPELLSTPASAPQENASLLLIGDIEYLADAKSGKPISNLQKALLSDVSLKISPLPGARKEMAGIHDLFGRTHPQGKMRELTGGQPTEGQVRDLAPQFKYVHLVTHGFFEQRKQPSAEEKESAAEFSSIVPVGDAAEVQTELLSGVVLAGAARRTGADEDDGFLTALEVQMLDLSGVEMVTLSACQTAMGLQAVGEGTLGLHRAFHLAGVRTTVASLWNVPDEATQQLMIDFYDGLWSKKLSRGEALRQAQLAMLREGSKKLPGVKAEYRGARLPPFCWAAFELSGDWR